MEFQPIWTEEPAELQTLQRHLLEHIEKKFGLAQRKPFAWVLRDHESKVVGGIAGFIHWGWAYVSQLWVEKSLEGQGAATSLLKQLEDWAKQNHLMGLYIDTFDNAVKDFYIKRGYEFMGQIPDFPRGHQRYFLYRKFSD